MHAKVRFTLTKKINHFNHKNFYKYLNKLHSNFNLYESTLMTFIYLYLFFYSLKIIRLVYACLGALIFGLVWTTLFSFVLMINNDKTVYLRIELTKLFVNKVEQRDYYCCNISVWFDLNKRIRKSSGKTLAMKLINSLTLIIKLRFTYFAIYFFIYSRKLKKPLNWYISLEGREYIFI